MPVVTSAEGRLVCKREIAGHLVATLVLIGLTDSL